MVIKPFGLAPDTKPPLSYRIGTPSRRGRCPHRPGGSSTGWFVFSVPVTFSVLTRRARHPRLRDDVGIVPYAGGGMFWVGRLRTRGIAGSGHETAPIKQNWYPPGSISSLTRGAVYRAVRFSVPVTFPVLTGRAGHPRLRDDVGIVPYAGGWMF